MKKNGKPNGARGVRPEAAEDLRNRKTLNRLEEVGRAAGNQAGGDAQRDRVGAAGGGVGKGLNQRSQCRASVTHYGTGQFSLF